MLEEIPPTLSITEDAGEWMVLYGDDVNEGIVGVGTSAVAAVLDFALTFHHLYQQQERKRARSAGRQVGSIRMILNCD